jgi:hypothetical protein
MGLEFVYIFDRRKEYPSQYVIEAGDLQCNADDSETSTIMTASFTRTVHRLVQFVARFAVSFIVG